MHACTLLLRGASKDVLNEVERNLMDAMFVARNVMRESRLVTGGGAIEMSISQGLMEKAKAVDGVAQWPYKALAIALEVIPRAWCRFCCLLVFGASSDIASCLRYSCSELWCACCTCPHSIACKACC